MKIGLFFGSFNPIHNGHLIISNFILNETDISKIWFIVSPQNPLKKSNSLLNEFDRLHLVRLAIQDDFRLKTSDVEFSLPKPSYTSNTLTYLSEKYPEKSFSIIMGSDGFQNINKWKNYEFILKNFPIYVYQRKDFVITETHSANIKLLNSPLVEISATQIRDYIRKKKSIRYLVPESVREEIETRRLYKQGA